MNNVFWAAFGGGAAAGIFTLLALLMTEWLRWYIDRPLVRPEMSLGFRVVEGLKPDDTFYAFLEASNPHTKAVTLNKFGFRYKGKEFKNSLIVTPQVGYQFPYTLAGGKSFSQWTPVKNLLHVLREDGHSPSDLGYVFFGSATGKIFLGKIERQTIEALEKACKDEFGGAKENE